MQTHADVKRSPGLDASDQRGVPEIGPLAEHLDVATVLKVTQAVSGEIVLEKLVEVLLRTAIEQAGAERALLILPRGSELWIQAEAKILGDSVTVRLNEAPVSAAELPESIVRHVARTQEIVILDDAPARNPYSADEYIRKQALRSVLCLPLMKQSTLVALLYLENNISPNIFAPAKVVVLRVLASAAAISLENCRLYRELQERESKVRRLVDANIIGVLISDSESQIIESNDAFLKMVGYTREELVSGRMSWRNMTPADWKDVSEQGVVQVKATGTCKPFEKEYYRKDGSRVPVLVGAARFEKNSIVAFAIDLTERKRAEEALQSISRDLQESKAKLEEAQRITHVGYWERDIETGRTTWSDETYRIFGLQPQERPMDLNAIMQMVHPEDREFVSRTQKEALVSGPRYDFEYRLLRPTGELRIVHAEGYVKKDVSGRPYQAFGTVQDITERKRAEEALRRSEFYLAEGQRLAHMGSWVLNPAGFDYWSSELFRVHGLAPSSVAPTLEEYMGLIHPEDREFVAEVTRKMFAVGCGFDFTKRIVRPDGEIRSVRCVGIPSPHGGTPQTFVGTGIDVTEQECILDELKRSEFYLAEGQRLGHAGSWSFTSDGTCDYWSRELYQILGFDPAAGIPTISDYFTRVHPQDRAVVEATIQRMITAGEGCDLKKRIIRPDGAQRIIRCVGMPVRENGVITRFVGTMMDITEQEELTQELRRSKAHLTNAQRLSHTGSVGMEVKTATIYWSEESARIYGYPAGTQPTPELILQRVHPDDVALLKSVLERAAQGGHDFEFEHRLLMPDGSIKYIFNLSQCVRDEAGNEEIIGAITDFTERKLAEEAIRRSEAFLAEGQRLSHTGSFGWKPDTGEIFWSAETYRIFEYDPAETPTIGLVAQRVHLEDRADFQSVVERASTGASDFEQAYRLQMPDGRVKHVHVLAHATQDVSGNREFVGAVSDVTDHKRAQESLRVSEAYLAEAQKVSNTGSWAWSPVSNTILFWSDQCYRILGHDPAKGLPSFAQLVEEVHPEDRPGVIESLDKAARSGSDWQMEYRLVNFDSGTRTVRCFAHPMLDGAGQVIKFVGTVMDITESRRVEDAIQRSEALLAEGQRLSHTGSWGWNALTGKLTWSQEHFRILGLDPEGTTPSLEVFWERVHPDDRDDVRRAFESAIRDKRDFVQEFRTVTPDWSIRYLHGVGHAVLNKGNELMEFIGSTMDITERKRAEERAQSYNESIRVALNAFVEELDVDRFLGHVMTGLIKQFQATFCELWLFDDPISATSLHLIYQQGKMVDAKTVGLQTQKLHTTWQPSNIGRIPRIIDIPDQASLLLPTHLQLLKKQGVKMLIAVPLVLGEQNLGVVELRFQETMKFTGGDLDLAQALVHHATLALQLSRLAHRTEQMAVTEERNRMAREIHDTLAQAFAGVVLHSEALGTALGANKSRSKRALSNIQKLARSGLEEARRSVQALRPRALESRTLSQALSQEAKRFSEDGIHSCEFKQKGEVLKLSAEVQNEFFRIAQEAMTNISKHAQAKSVWITLEFKNNQATLIVRDDGIGFSATDSPKPKGGYGLSTMRERALRIGGKLEIESPASGGTVIRVVASLDKKLQPSNQST